MRYNYTEIDFVSNSKISIFYNSGKEQAIVPITQPLQYYGNFTNGTIWVSEQNDFQKIKFPVGNFHYKDCFGWIGPVPILTKSDFTITVSGISYNSDGSISDFGFKKKWQGQG